MLLGTLLTRLETAEYATALLESLGDIILLARIGETAGRYDETPGGYASTAVARFSRDAGDEDWLAVMTALERADDPAAACLRHMVEWALGQDIDAMNEAPESCTCGGQGGCHAPP
jgi:hypothetical protein